jgi:hypothetical protein
MHLTRRQLLQMFPALPAVLLACRSKDVLDEERVCIHVFDPTGDLPEPLRKTNGDIPSRPANKRFFNIGLPEVLLCTTKTTFLESFQYFWPVTRDEYCRMSEAISVQYAKRVLQKSNDIADLSRYLTEHRSALRSKDPTSALILTYNDYTALYTDRIVQVCAENNINELVIFKDPTKAPYLCDYPSHQKGFKKPPP